ncbi:ribonuclease T2 [Atractiella rhizophila]|nr:ribonuclease T2 [Atractiella rhizophila]
MALVQVLFNALLHAIVLARHLWGRRILLAARMGKHGTCISTLATSCYSSYTTGDEAVDFFVRTVALFKTLPTYTWLSNAGITPSSSKTYTLSALQAAIKSAFGQQVYFGCDGSTLNEIWYYHNTKGNIASGTFIPVAPVDTSTCPSSGIQYLPKGSSSGGGGGGGSGSGPSSGDKGTLVISTGTGCVLSAGTWSTQTCATFTATASGSGFTLKSSKGNCGVSSGSFTCGSGVTATVFTFSGADLAYSGSTAFSANSVPSGTTQVTILSGSSGSQDFQIEWSAS